MSTFAGSLSPRDQQALDAARASGALPLPSADWLSELEPERAVMIGLARHLAGLEAVVENVRGEPSRLGLVAVRDEWPEGTDPARYPAATLLPQTTTPWDAKTGIPYRVGDEDVVSPDERWGLWRLGEDVGTGVVHLFASYKAHRNALLSAVSQALFGSLDPLQGLALPLPEILLPAPFRGLLPVEALPKAYVSLADGGGPVDDESAGASGLWRADVYFRWQAPRLAARPRIADLRTDLTVRVGPPGEEI